MTCITKDKMSFLSECDDFFKILFAQTLERQLGEIELRIFSGGHSEQYFFQTSNSASTMAYDLCNAGVDVYFGVNPRTQLPELPEGKKKGEKKNIHYLTTFHAEIDYGSIGHKNKSLPGKDDALFAINNFIVKPTLVLQSGGGFHVYWVLNEPLQIKSDGDFTIETIEGINSTLSKRLGGDSGTQDISRILRVPGTFNYKIPENPREVVIVENTGCRYSFDDLKAFIPPPGKTKDKESKSCIPIPITYVSYDVPVYISCLPVPKRIQHLILHGNDGSYPSRSEADMAVLLALVRKEITETEIRKIFRTCGIGEKYTQHNSPEQYLSHSISKARQMLQTISNLTDEELCNPLYTTGSVYKDNGKVRLNIVNFQEYIVTKYKIRKVEHPFFKYNNTCYELCKEDEINHICQSELDIHRHLFKPGMLNEFLHFAVGQIKMDEHRAKNDQMSHLTLRNGLFNLSDEKLYPHSAEVFTTNELPYDFDPEADCPRFKKYLDEVFFDDKELISFIQEAVGYTLYKGIPLPALFFLIGPGSNGKSVFMDVLIYLLGEHNTCSISLNNLSEPIYLSDLFGKMLNISAETPQRKKFNTDIIKAVVAGDMVTGKALYKDPFRFRPFAKHFLSMNKEPAIDDTTHGMWRRIYIIPFMRKFSKTEMDTDLREKLKKELPGILNWALEGYRKLRKKHFILDETQKMEALKQQYQKGCSSVLSFLSEKIVIKSGSKITLKEAYESYIQFCTSEGHRYPEKKSEFRLMLDRNDYRVERSTKDANQICIYDVAHVLQENEK